MTNQTSIQAENENGLRAYPFTDDSSLLDSNGRPLPASAIIDACVLSKAGVPVYLSEITGLGEAVFMNSGTKTEAGRCVITEGQSPLYLDSVMPAGTVVFGPGYGSLLAMAPAGFAEASAVLCPACILPIPGLGVLSLTVPGSFPVSGDVTLRSGLGAVVTCIPSDSSIRVDFIGAEEPADACTGNLYIRKLCFEVWSGSKFSVGAVDGTGTVSVSHSGPTLTEACASSKYGKLPDSNGNLPGSAEYVAQNLMTPEPVATIKTAATLLYSFEIDATTALGAVTLVSFPASGEDPSRLRIRGTGDGNIELSLLG
jgi:hypothetical protein